MYLKMPIRQWLCVPLVLSLGAGVAIGGDGLIVVPSAPGCPCCNGYSGPCPANVKYYGYYPTHWRQWPGTQPAPAPVPAVIPQPTNVQVPPAIQEALGKPGETTDTGMGNAQAAPPADSGGSAVPTNPAVPNGTAPGANPLPATSGPATPGPTLPGATPPAAATPGPNTPMLNGLPLPSGSQPPGAAPVTGPFSNDGTTPGAAPFPGGRAPNILPTPEPGTTKGSQLFEPSATPMAISIRPQSVEPARLNQVWPGPAQPMPSQAVSNPPNALRTLSGQTSLAVLPAAQPDSVPPVIAPTTMTDNAQPTTPMTAPAANQWPPANMLRSSTIRTGFQSPADSAAPRPSNSTAAAWIEPLPPIEQPRSRIGLAGAQGSGNENLDSLRIVGERPAQAVPITADDWSSKSEGMASNANPGSAPTATARWSIPSGQPGNQPIHPASYEDRSHTIWPAANFPGAWAPIDRGPPAASNNVRSGVGMSGNPAANAPGAICSATGPARPQVGPAAEIRFSPLRDAVANLHTIADDRTSTSMTAIDPLQIGRTTAEDQQPAMKSLPIENGLPKQRFEAADYVSPDRGATTRGYTGAPWPVAGGSAWGAGAPSPAGQRPTDNAVQQASFQQAGATAQTQLQSIDPLEVARSLGPIPSGPVAAPVR